LLKKTKTLTTTGFELLGVRQKHKKLGINTPRFMHFDPKIIKLELRKK
jgi:hypothetical protein